MISDLPSTATITSNASEPEDGQSVSFDCSATPGKPDIDDYVWYHQGDYKADTVSSTWILSAVNLATDDGEYTCAGRNTVGPGPTSNPAIITVYCKYM